MPLPIFIVDAFATHAFAGNPAAVVTLDAPATSDWMQRVAMEMNLSETVFVSPDDDDARSIRWFTPRQEVELCGHATLAASHLLWEEGLAPDHEPIRYTSMSGPLTATREPDARITLDFPAVIPHEEPLPDALRASLPSAAWFGAGGTKMLALLPTEDDVLNYTPDLTAIAAFKRIGLIVTAPSDDPADHFVSRFFAPGVGIDEDPVCGSAHCLLAPFWSQRLGQNRLRARQISPRGGQLELTVSAGRVTLTGAAVTTLRGHLSDAACPQPHRRPQPAS